MKNKVTQHSLNKVFLSLTKIFNPHSTESVTDWACRNIMFSAPGRTMPFSIHGREFIREPLDSFNNPRVRDLVFISGSQVGKTSMLLAGAGYIAVNRPSRIFWVMPTEASCLKFYKSRLKKVEMESPAIRELITNTRTDLTPELQFLGASMIEMTGANSPSGLAGSPCRVVVLDEVGKFPLQTGIEADAVNLAHQRVKDFSQSLVVTTSTPVLVSSPEWQEYLKGDQRRYHVPCVHCGKLIVFAWSAELNSMPRLGCEAYVHWDQKAKLGNKWDYLEVRNSAHFVCPFCNGKIFEREKREMIKKGEWIATNRNGDEAFRSYHISSLYACSSSATNLGNEAVKFLKEKRAQRLQGFVNGELAEPWSYVASVKRSELILSASVKHEGEWFRFLTADYHLNEPFLWWVVREWNLKGDSHLINFGSMNSFKELEEVQKMYQIPDSQVFIDSGFNAQRVYEECLLRGKREPYPPNGIGYRRERNVPPVWVHFGWTPVKGYTTQKNWYDEETGIPVVFSWAEASILSDDIALPVLQFSTSQLKDMLRAMRLRETEQIWAVTDIVDKRSSVYWQHLDAEEVKEDSRGKFFWEKKHSRLPNHLLDCEVYQVGAAVAFEILKIKEEECESV